MKSNSSNSEILNIIQSGLSADDKNRLTDPFHDPARVFHKMSDDEIIPSNQENVVIPSVTDIAIAFTNHVLGGEAPYEMIVGLLSPFCDENTHIILEPGKGLKRPTYKVSIPHLDLNFGRAAPRVVAIQIHHFAEKLAAFEIGARAPQNAPEFLINVKGTSRHLEQMPIKAKNAKTLLRTYAEVFGSLHIPVYAPVEITRADLLKHTFAALEILAEEDLGLSEYRRQALDLIAAAQHLRMTATAAMRLNSGTPKKTVYQIDINPFSTPMIEISQHNDESLSSHEQIAFISRNKAVFDALAKSASCHDVLRKLPRSFSIQMVGEADALSISIRDNDLPQGYANHKILSGYLNRETLDDLAQRLAPSPPQETKDDAQWRLELSGNILSSHGWELKGKTLAHAFANAVKDKKHPGMILSDLSIDLAADADGEATDFNLYRIIHSK